jgi:hypothetical protein
VTERAARQSFLQRLFHGRGVDVFIAVAALFVSAVSLWVGVRTEIANEQLVRGSTWPFVQIEISNSDPDGNLDLKFNVVNTGVGPAKIESFELFWKDKPFRSSNELLEQCCGFKVVKATSPEAKHHTPLIAGGVQGVVLRPGDTEEFIHYKLNADNLAVWSALNRERERMSYRICYCSVLDQCWQAKLRSELYLPGQLHPEQVKTCPAPAVPYTK